MRSSVLDADVNELCIRIMKRLIEKTQNDENISVNKNTIFEEVHDTSTGIYAFESDNNTLKERVFQELLARGHITQDNNSENHNYISRKRISRIYHYIIIDLSVVFFLGLASHCHFSAATASAFFS
jgi:hypothetical protein